MLPLVVKNLLIINGLFFLTTLVFETQLNFDLSDYLGLHYPLAESFRPWQLVSYMFMHGNFMHLFFNMFALWMFGNTLENYWGPKRFLIYYMATGIGAGIIQLLVTHFRLMSLYSQISEEGLNFVITKGSEIYQSGQNFSDPIAGKINLLMNSVTIGASGAVFGILLAFGMLFPNTLLYIYFAIPIKAKWFVVLYGAVELYSGIANSSGDNVAHFAHLGGMLFGFILIKFWQKRRNNTY
ncbi:MAG: rhomboid family intramembrane serine protease [Bacteroidota bacterium]